MQLNEEKCSLEQQLEQDNKKVSKLFPLPAMLPRHALATARQLGLPLPSGAACILSKGALMNLPPKCQDRWSLFLGTRVAAMHKSLRLTCQDRHIWLECCLLIAQWLI